MRDEARDMAFILIVLFLGMLFVVWKGRVDLGREHDVNVELQLDLARERAFSDEVFAENQQLRDANGRLRLRILELEVNLSEEEQKVGACLARMPGLAGEFPQVSGRNRVRVSDLLITPDLVTINVANLTPGVIAPTGSMEPFLDGGTIVLERRPTGTADVFLGDIIIYELDGERVIHRVMRIGWDDLGWFAVTKGDNNPVEDPLPVRFGSIQGVVVGVIY